MKTNEEIKRLNSGMKQILGGAFNFVVGLVNAGITIYLLLGAVFSMYLVYRLFPEAFYSILTPFMTILTILLAVVLFVIKVGLMLLVFWGINYLILKFIDIRKPIIERKRKERLKELAQELKKEMRKK